MLSTLIPLMSVGFTLGLMHALDADHVMAVSVLSNEKPGLLRTMRFSANWALGHGGVLMLSGLLLFGLGLNIPEPLIHVAEMAVGVLLIALGLIFFWRFRQQKLILVEHNHGAVVHTHWHEKGGVTQQGHQNTQGKESHAPAMVGVLHGLAGSAPALALIPAMAQGEMGLAMAYLLVFSLGVMLSMVMFGLGLGVMQKKLKEKYEKLFEWSRHLIAGSSILIGSYWLSQAL